MTSLLILGAGGLAREALAVEQLLGRFDQVALIDDDHSLWGTQVGGAPVLGGLEHVMKHPTSSLVVCVGQGSARRHIVNRLTELDIEEQRYTTIIDPRVSMSSSCTVGRGSVLLAGTVLTTDVQLGRHVVAMPHVTLTHDDVVEDYVTLCAGVTLGGEVHVGEAAYLGMASSVRERLDVGAGSVLGMAAALLEPLPVGETWAGVPARPLNLTRKNRS